MKRAGSIPLAAMVAVIWLVVWVVTQVTPSPPLSVGPTLLLGLILTEAAIIGYWSILRGPRRRGRSRAATLDPTADTTLAEVSRTLPYLRRGLAEGTADRAAKAILPLSGAKQVSITDTDRVLGRAGSGHSFNGSGLGYAIDSAIDRGETTILPVANSADWQVAVPMRVDGHVAGALHAVVEQPGDTVTERVQSLASLVSLHLELAHLTQKSQLATDAKLDALRSQINPHFLFNTLNTIANKSRTDTEATRQLLQRLAEFFRYAIRQEGQYTEFANEYYFVRTYVALEQARFDDRLKVHYDVDPQVLSAPVPVLTIQPLVENAVKHGLARKPGGGTVTLRARAEPLASSTRIMVRDDGIGMEPEVLAGVLDGTYTSDTGGVGLANISQRLQTLFGTRYSLNIRSSPDRGTRVDLEIPF